MIAYTTGGPDDAKSIAALHAQSWSLHYRGEFTDHYLDHEVQGERLVEWQKRMTEALPTQHVVLATEDHQLCGFACVYLAKHEKWGALLDNLHVEPSYMGKGVGRRLMQEAAKWVQTQDDNSSMFLWVLASNEGASRFYERIGGEKAEETMMENPGGGASRVWRYVWDDLGRLINKGRR
ncbi:MAG: GNAT family N-acetyltransferase [Saprospiraceae bacterium]|nr:GNAT family N-acetyltransferase [Saprospiraceae bacterium]